MFHYIIHQYTYLVSPHEENLTGKNRMLPDLINSSLKFAGAGSPPSTYFCPLLEKEEYDRRAILSFKFKCKNRRDPSKRIRRLAVVTLTTSRVKTIRQVECLTCLL